MPKLAANLSMLFTEQPFLDRFASAAQCGFEAVECQFPYAYESGALREALDRHALSQVLHNLPAGDWAGGERGIACHPDRQDEFRESVALAIEYARALDCPRLNCLAGVMPPGCERQLLDETLVTNLEYAAKQLDAAGLTLLLEPINTRDIPGFFVADTKHALDLLARVGAPNLRLQYDVYHMQVMEGDLAHTIERHIDKIGHVQIADNPGRHEPGTGEINYPFLLALLDKIGYEGWVGCEYRPQTQTRVGLGWARRYLTRARSA
jgi:hydroxypyruvate isomerase